MNLPRTSHMTFAPTLAGVERAGVKSEWLWAAVGLIGWLFICFAPAFAAIPFPPDAWYAHLAKPDWNPPGWIFASVWPALYASTAVSAWLVWSYHGWSDNRPARAAFTLQWLLNAAWTPVCFGLHALMPALLVAIALCLTIAATIGFLWRDHRVAALLLIPYQIWVLFAVLLNVALVQMN